MRGTTFEGRRRASAAMDLVPLINIVFLLLIFFMLTSTLVTPDAFDVTPPESQQGDAAPAAPTVVLVGPDGALALNNEPVALSGLEPGLAAARVENPGSPLLIKADAQATTADVMAVLRRARAAGVERVGLATASGS